MAELSEADLEPRYFVMTCERSTGPLQAIQAIHRGRPWMDGKPVGEVKAPVAYALDPERRGTLKPMYDTAALLIRDDLLTTIQKAGVTNLQMFPAVLRDPVTNVEHTDYKAVNILGLVECADREKSVLVSPAVGFQPMDTDFAELVIDESKVPTGRRLFRLAEAVSAIIVHRTVKDAIEAAGIPGMCFYGPGEWSG